MSYRDRIPIAVCVDPDATPVALAPALHLCFRETIKFPPVVLGLTGAPARKTSEVDAIGWMRQFDFRV
jgi:hypothetical protein